MAFIITGPKWQERGPVVECGICGCKSNLWNKNNKNLPGKISCPGQKRMPDLHDEMARIQGWIADATEQEEWTMAEKFAFSAMKLRAKFNRVPPDVVLDGSMPAQTP